MAVSSVPLSDELLKQLDDDDVEVLPTLVDDRATSLSAIAGALQGLQGPPGRDGADGPPGPVGPAGPSGGGYYLHIQAIPEAEWLIDHQLGRFPAVTLFDSTGAEVEGAVSHLSVNQCAVTFSAAFSGKASCN